jgi:hypothetical protein
VTNRQRLATTLLWIAVVFVGTMFGASVYQRISLIPEWSSDLPHSVTRYFLDTNAGVAMDRFWTVVTAPTAVTILFAFISTGVSLAGGVGFHWARSCFS